MVVVALVRGRATGKINRGFRTIPVDTALQDRFDCLSPESHSMVQFFSFGRPRDYKCSREPTQPIVSPCLQSCVGYSLVSADPENASIQCGFAEDTDWKKEMPGQDAERGFAALKLRIHTTQQGTKPLHRIEHVLRFSQTTDDKFHSVHQCWPLILRGTPSSTDHEHEATLNPSVPTPFGEALLFEIRHLAQRSQQSNWVVGSQLRQSEGMGGGRYDEITVFWEALDANDRTKWANRPLYSSAVVRCEFHPLTISAAIYGYKRSLHLGGFRARKKILACSSIQFKLRDLGTETDADTLCEELESWTKNVNARSVTEVA